MGKFVWCYRNKITFKFIKLILDDDFTQYKIKLLINHSQQNTRH